MTVFPTLLSGTAQGLWWAVLALGVYITFRLLDFADLTVEGSFPLGAAVSAVLINAGVNPFVSLLCAFAAGLLAGCATGLLNTVCRIPPILAGILTMSALYSVNMRILSGKATVTIEKDTVRTALQKLLPIQNVNLLSALGGVAVCAVLVALLYAFFGTEIGCAIRATGHNRHMARSLGVSTRRMTILALMLSNGMIALAGSFVAQFDYGSAQVTMGQGSIVIGLASVIIGEVVFCHRDHNFAYKLTAVVLGAVIYRCIIAFATRVDFLLATDLKIIAAVIVAIALTVPVVKGKLATRRLRRDNDRRLAAAAAPAAEQRGDASDGETQPDGEDE